MRSTTRSGDRDAQPDKAVRPGSGEKARIVFDELVRSRDRLADLPAPTAQDLERVQQIMHEVYWHLMTPPKGARTELALSEDDKRQLVACARDRDTDVYVATVGLLALKLSARGAASRYAVAQLDVIRDALDALMFDYRRPKGEIVKMLRGLRSDIDDRIAYAKAQRETGYRFLTRPEAYRARKDKSETPDRFFQRVYGSHVARGLTQADIRRADPAFYNVLHVWCTRHQRKLGSLVPTRRPRRQRR